MRTRHSVVAGPHLARSCYWLQTANAVTVTPPLPLTTWWPLPATRAAAIGADD